MGLLSVSVKTVTEFPYALQCPLSLFTLLQLSLPHSLSASGFVSSLEKNSQKGHTCLTCTSSETKFFSQLFINRTDGILLVSLFLFLFFFPTSQFSNQCTGSVRILAHLFGYSEVVSNHQYPALHSDSLAEKCCWYSKNVCTLFQLQSYH